MENWEYPKVRGFIWSLKNEDWFSSNEITYVDVEVIPVCEQKWLRWSQSIVSLKEIEKKDLHQLIQVVNTTNQSYQSILENSHNAFHFLPSLTGTILDANKYCAVDLFGYSLEELRQSWRDRNHWSYALPCSKKKKSGKGRNGWVTAELDWEKNKVGENFNWVVPLLFFQMSYGEKKDINLYKWYIHFGAARSNKTLTNIWQKKYKTLFEIPYHVDLGFLETRNIIDCKWRGDPHIWLYQRRVFYNLVLRDPPKEWFRVKLIRP